MRIITTTYAEHQADIRAVRDVVFIEEQSVPADLEHDDRDVHCLHVLALDGEQAVGTARIDFDKNGKIGRMAVLQGHRRRGIGERLIDALEQAARQRGLASTWLHAQESALRFYETLGYAIEGEPFVEAGIPHRMMRKGL